MINEQVRLCFKQSALNPANSTYDSTYFKDGTGLLNSNFQGAVSNMTYTYMEGSKGF